MCFTDGLCLDCIINILAYLWGFFYIVSSQKQTYPRIHKINHNIYHITLNCTTGYHIILHCVAE